MVDKSVICEDWSGSALMKKLLDGVLNWSLSMRSCNGMTVTCLDLKGVLVGVDIENKPCETIVSSLNKRFRH